MRRMICSAATGMTILLAAFPFSSGAQPAATSYATRQLPTLTTWSERVFRDIDRRLNVRAGLRGSPVPSGIAAVKFNCSETGAPDGIEIYKSSGFRELDRATMNAVRQVASLHPLPAGLKHDQVYVVRILFADSPQAAERQLAQMRREATKSNAWYDSRATHTAAIELTPLPG